jgi:outer membrane lipase/esterase
MIQSNLKQPKAAQSAGSIPIKSIVFHPFLLTYLTDLPEHRMKLTVNAVTAVTGALLRASAVSAMVACSVVWLASCGGSASQAERFVASRVLAFGDEYSVINSDGSKYSVNALAPDGVTLDCNANPLWVQSVASLYGITYPQCPGNVAVPTGRILATPGATVANLATQIDQQINAGGIRAGDLVTVLVGANDVVAKFSDYPVVSEPELLAQMDALGAQLAQQVNRLAGLNAKVLISTIPDLGITPFAGNRSGDASTNGNPGLLSRLSKRFNDALLARIINDGRKIGLILLDEFLQLSDRASGQALAGSYINTAAPSCTAPLPTCTTNTQVAGATTATWLWADPRRLGAGGQASLAGLAVTRLEINPF